MALAVGNSMRDQASLRTLLASLCADAHLIGASLAIMIFAGGHISGGHFNPAVTLAVWLRGKCPTGDVVPYWVAQFGGHKKCVHKRQDPQDPPDRPLHYTQDEEAKEPKKDTDVNDWCALQETEYIQSRPPPRAVTSDREVGNQKLG